MSPEIRLLGAPDRARLEDFLAADPDRTLFLRSNLAAAGIAYDGRTFSAQYTGAFEHGALVAVAAHCWNDMLLVHAPRHLEALVRAAVSASGRRVAGLAGVWPWILAAQSALGLAGARTNMASRDILFALQLDALEVPRVLDDPGARVTCRLATAADLDVLTAYRVAYSKEILGAPDAAELAERCRAEVAQLIGRDAWLLMQDERPVACSFFNARVPDTVQIGGVFTPPELRGRGFGRAVVAGSLLAVRAQGVRRSVLFTGEHNAAAQAAYTALGYRAIGEYGLILLAE